MQVLEDNSMNLQSMAGSQFVGPFLPIVQKWERALATIGEVNNPFNPWEYKYLKNLF